MMNDTVTKAEKTNRIIKLFKESSLIIGFSPITPTDIESTMDRMAKRGLFEKNENNFQRKARTIKSLVKSWAHKNLGIKNDEWDKINVVNIKQTSETSSVIFLTCKTMDDITMITSKVHNLPKEYSDDQPRVVPWVPIQGKDRYRAILEIGKKMRETSATPIKTSVRNGRVDFLLRFQPKSQNKKWNQIPPVKITHKIPDFNVGIIKENIKDKENEDDEIANDLRNNNKRKIALSKETDDKIDVEFNDEEILNEEILNDTSNHNKRN